MCTLPLLMSTYRSTFPSGKVGRATIGAGVGVGTAVGVAVGAAVGLGTGVDVAAGGGV